MRKLFVIFAFVALFCANSSAQRLALNTDVVMDGLGAPSLGVEMTMAKRSTLNLNAIYSNSVLWKNSNKMIAFQPEWRYYLSGRPMYAYYIGGVGIFADYDLKLSGKVYSGHAFGAGLSFGYVFPITKRLNVSVHSSAALVYYRQKYYFDGDDYNSQYLDEDGNVKPNDKGTMFMPIRFGVAVSYTLKY